MKQALKTKDDIKNYRDKVNQYKNERNRDVKNELIDIINRIKGDFRTEIFKSHPKMRELLRFQKRIDELNSRHLFEKYNEDERKFRLGEAREGFDKITAEIEAIKSNAIYKNAFEWRFEFPKVLDNDGNFLGFDMVIGNPPYIRQEEIGELKPYLKKDYTVFAGTADILVYFYELGLRLLKYEGSFSFITSNKFMRANYGKSLREFLGNFELNEIIDFGDAPVFGGIAAYASIVNLRKRVGANGKHQTRVYTFPVDDYVPDFEASYHADGFNIAQKSLTLNGWRLERTDVLDLLAKLRRKGKPLGEYVNGRFYYGIKTGLGEAFIVDSDTRDRLIIEDSSSAEILKPFLRGRNIKRWQVNFDDLYLIKIESSANKKHAWSEKTNIEAERIFSETYPAIYNHLQGFRKKLINRDDQGVYFWELRSCVYWHEFEQPKILLGRFMNKPTFAFDKNGYFNNDALYMIPDANEFVVAVLNSSICWWFLSQICTDLQNGYIQAFRENLFEIPIPKISPEAQEPFVELVDEILELKKRGENTDEQENKIDEMVFDLYDLTEDERRIVRGEAAAA